MENLKAESFYDLVDAKMAKKVVTGAELKAEREKLFGRTKSFETKKSKAQKRLVDNHSVRDIFDIAHEFQMRYGHPFTKAKDMSLFLIYLCSLYELEVSDFLSKSRYMPRPQARKMASFFLTWFFGLRDSEIGIFINRDRSTIVTHVQECADEINYDAKSKRIAFQLIEFLDKLLRSRKK